MRRGQQLVGPETTLEQMLRVRERLEQGAQRMEYRYPDDFDEEEARLEAQLDMELGEFLGRVLLEYPGGA